MELPGKGLVRGYESGGQASGKAAASAWGALGSIGQQIAGLGERGAALLVQHEQAAVKRKSAEMELEFDKLQTDYQAQMLKNPNLTPEEAVSGWEKMATGFSQKYQGDGLSPLEQEVLGFRSKQLVQKGTGGVLQTSLLANIQNTKQAAVNLVQRGETTGNEELRQQGFSMLKGIVPDADIEAQRMDSDRRVATNQVTADIQANPLSMAGKLDDPEKLMKEYPGIHVADIPRLKSQLESVQRQSVGNQVDSFNDGLATGAISSTDDIERIYKDTVPPRILEDMKIQYNKRFDETRKAWMQSPMYRAQKEGEVSNLVTAVQGTRGETFDQLYANASFGVAELPDGPGKNYLTEKLRAAKEGRTFEIKTRTDAAFKSLETYNKAERDKLPAVEKIKVSDAVEAGFLQDAGKLQSLGFSPEQAGFIVGEKNNADRMEKFRDLWTLRGKAAPSVEQDVWQTAMAIRTGSSEVDYISPEAEDAAITASIEADRREGQRLVELSEFLKVTPDATPDDIDNKILDIVGNQKHESIKQWILSVPNSSPKGASDSTSYVPIGSNLGEVVKNFEAGGAPGGYHPQAYWDEKQWSIGYGTKSKKGEKISKAEAESRLSAELSDARQSVDRVASNVGMDFTDTEKDALTSFTYNLGEGRLEQLLANGSRSKAEIADMMLLYRNAGGKRLFGLEKRRAAERELFLKGYSVRN